MIAFCLRLKKAVKQEAIALFGRELFERNFTLKLPAYKTVLCNKKYGLCHAISGTWSLAWSVVSVWLVRSIEGSDTTLLNL